ncbi:choline transporter-like protein 4 isoform X1 [Hydractinia symbiolongicarpus]|uniref:choline transporter-like protein 4 isoform X1 n=1 Tax=Hydractinia symbiolongicarpus TaxID=13093 RepID=UPI00254AEEF6|nr:choline transporter-like protein 4 isoform X1 [Hydractinia symbiolongicarpus]
MGCCGNNEAEPIELNQHGVEDKEPAGQYGKSRKYDPNFSGPIKNRSCTDIICCVLFLLYFIGMLAVGILAYSTGDPTKLLYPTDSHGDTCGEGKHADRKNLFYFDLLECIPKSISEIYSLTACKTHQICVKNCPTDNTYSKTADRDKLYCKYDAQSKVKTMSSDEIAKNCAKYTLQSTDLAYRCVPTLVGGSLSNFLKSNTINTDGKNLTVENIKWGTIAQSVLVNIQNTGRKVVADVQESWYWILAGFGITMIVAFIYILIMRWVAGLMVWLTTYAVLTIIGYCTYYCYTEYDRLASTDTSDIGFDFVTNLDSYSDKKETWLVLGIICAIILLVILLLLLALRKRIQIAIQLIKEGSRALTAMISTLFFPLLPWLMQLILFCWFVAVLAFLVTAGDAEFEQVNNGTFSKIACTATDAINDWIPGSNDTISCNFKKYVNNDNILRLQVFHLFGWFWIMNFIVAFGQCALAGAFASWYWAWDKKTDVPTLPVLMSVGRTLRYHTGSLAFGSLIIAIVQIIRAGLEYLEWKLRGSGHEPGPVAKFILKCLKCFFWCLEKFLKFLNKNAYIEIAVYGKNFCTSAKNAFFLLMRNILRVAVLDKVTDFLLFIGKLTVTGGMGVASFFFFNKRNDLNYYLTPVIIITIGAWVVTSAFFGVYEMAINTLFLCFLEDCERHDGSPEKPYYMSKKLKKILGKKNKKTEEDE